MRSGGYAETADWPGIEGQGAEEANGRKAFHYKPHEGYIRRN